MLLDAGKTLLKKVEEAEYILVGIGEEWTPSLEELLLDPVFSKELAIIPDDVSGDFTLSMLKKKYFEDFHSEQIKSAYQNLYHLCEGKKYFLVSLNQEKYPILSGFDQDKCVFPCGNFDFLQCEENCQNSLLDAEEEYQRFLGTCLSNNKENSIDDDMQNSNPHKMRYSLPECPFCHSPLAFNRVEAKKYCEGGYLDKWQSYMKFLTQTVNRKLCILELGVSMRYPGIIRNAFERTAIYSQKAFLFRIHHSLTDLPEPIQDRSYGKKENSVHYMSNLFVSQH